MNEGPFNKREIVRTPDNRVGSIKKLNEADGRYIVEFEDGSEQPYPETSLKRVKILKG